MNRRAFLSVGVGSLVFLAGCIADSPGGPSSIPPANNRTNGPETYTMSGDFPNSSSSQLSRPKGRHLSVDARSGRYCCSRQA